METAKERDNLKKLSIEQRDDLKEQSNAMHKSMLESKIHLANQREFAQQALLESEATI